MRCKHFGAICYRTEWRSNLASPPYDFDGSRATGACMPLPRLHRQPWMDDDVAEFRDQVRRYIDGEIAPRLADWGTPA